jgi:hypothetical protein
VAGAFTFVTKVKTGSPYGVTVKTQPKNPVQTCAVTSGGSGTMGSANVTNVAVDCTTTTFEVGGNAAGLPNGATAVLTNNNGDDLNVTANGPFKFATKVASKAAYSVKVKTHPVGTYCGLTKASGTVVDAAITDVALTCAAATSCKAIKTVAPDATDGKYTLTPTGGVAYDAYCDMTTDGGGWTLALKAGGASVAFQYDAAIWTNATTLAPESTDLSKTEAKFASFSNIKVAEVAGVIDTAGVLRTVKVAQVADSLQALFSGPFVATNVTRTEWMKLVPGSGLQPNCNKEGFNNELTGFSKVRFGILGNQENDCNSPDSFVGFGTAGGPCNAGNAAVGNKASCAPVLDVDGAATGDKLIQSFGYLFVR